MATFGEERVGVSFNPSGNPQVNDIKGTAAILINMIKAVPGGHPEIERLKALAMTAAEEAAMWGVKAATKKVGE